jgi:hypothetical protein
MGDRIFEEKKEKTDLLRLLQTFNSIHNIGHGNSFSRCNIDTDIVLSLLLNLAGRRIVECGSNNLPLSLKRSYEKSKEIYRYSGGETKKDPTGLYYLLHGPAFAGRRFSSSSSSSSNNNDDDDNNNNDEIMEKKKNTLKRKRIKKKIKTDYDKDIQITNSLPASKRVRRSRHI